jgi:hypothetical protein
VTGARLESFVQLEAWLVTLVGGLLMLAAWRGGFVVARGRNEAERARAEPHASSLAQWCLGLFGLLQAFAFGTVYAKYEARRADVVVEANAISTFTTAVEVFPANVRGPVMAGVARYVRLHRAAGQPDRSREDRVRIDGQIRALQLEIAARVVEHVRTPAGAPFAILVLPAMNDAFDQYEARVAGLAMHTPYVVLALLLVVSVLSAYAVGRAEGHALAVQPRSTLLFILLALAVLYATLDLDQPWTGLSRVSDLPMERLEETLGGT